MSELDERIKELGDEIEAQRQHLRVLQVRRAWDEKPDDTVIITCTKSEVAVAIGGYVCKLREHDKARADFLHKVREYLQSS